MGMRFNPSSNQYTDLAMKTLLGLATEEYKLSRKKESATQLIKQLKEGGLLGEEGDFEVSGYDASTGVPKIGKKGGFKPTTRQGAIDFEADKHKAKYGTDSGLDYTGPLNVKPAAKKVTNWGDVNFLGRMGAAMTPSATPSEKQLGGLRPGGVFRPPQPKQDFTLPPGITTTTQAVEFLVQKGMSREKAIEYLRQKNTQ